MIWIKAVFADFVAFFGDILFMVVVDDFDKGDPIVIENNKHTIRGRSHIIALKIPYEQYFSTNIAIFVFVVALLRQKRLKAADFWLATQQRKLKTLYCPAK